MAHPLSRNVWFAGASVLLLIVLLAGGLLLQSLPAQAQTSMPQTTAPPSAGVMSVPPCQCSAQTSLTGGGNSPWIYHCVCGAMSCAAVLSSGGSGPVQHLQCVR